MNMVAFALRLRISVMLCLLLASQSIYSFKLEYVKAETLSTIHFYTVPEIDVSGNRVSIVGDGSNTPSPSNNTNFGKVQIVSETASKSFIIENLGSSNLTLGTISLSGSASFSISNKPASGTTITPGNSETVTIAFHTTTEGIKSAILNIASNDADEANFQINLTAEGDKVFFDSDNDGVYDDMDIDDDNDGIIDSYEENTCRLSSSASQVNYKFLNETFGSGTTRTTINSFYNAYTSYCYEDGTASCPVINNNNNLGDGKYTVYYQAANGDSTNNTPNGEVASWADNYWYTGEDHTSGDTNGRMAMFNASYDPGIFYTATINGALPNVPITYSFWVLNLDTTTAPGIATRLRPNILVEFRDVNDNVLASITTGDIPPSINGDAENSWHQFTANLTLNVSEFYVYFINNEVGGSGNDLAIDDIEISQTLCDLDGDGVADVFDLDSDNDGIPDVVESNPTAASLSEGKATLTNVNTWVDANGNGMHDTTEGISPVNSDSDLIPDYLDLDSDNDGLFDVDEYRTTSTSAPANFQNGDGDINGDGTGDGLETESYREKDSEGDGIIEYFGDGILDVYDYHQGAATFSASFGNINQGSAPLFALDSDGDGIPNYKDPTNNITSINDIETVEIYAHLPNTNGILNDITDLDGDGIVASRDSDDTIFGSPRDLDGSYSLYFDGRNDYVEDTNLISSGSATLMAFIKSDGQNTNASDRMVAGQSDFYIKINEADNTITAVSEGINLTSTTTITDGIWTHVAVTTQSGGDVLLYVNGVEEDKNTSGMGGINSSTDFSIGCSTSLNNYFKGEIDEVRVFNTALTKNNLKRMVYQELDDANSFNSGKIIPLNISNSLGNNLVRYYKMDGYQDDILDNKKTPSADVSGAKMYNFKDIYFQRAPLPYTTSNDGNWTDDITWTHGDQWDITTKQNNTEDATIVHIKHNVNLNGTYNTQGSVGIILDSGKEFSIEADKGLYNSWYLKLDGLIDLDGESQLVQTHGSILDVTSAGKIERDQQGTKDYFTYNYWSSPVGTSNSSSNNNSYKMTDNVLKNGTIPSAPKNINFTSSGYNGCVSGNDITIADYWIWKYSNSTYGNYYSWQHVRRNGTLLAGEGFTMKGVDNTNGSINLTQNYVFNGKPNNGDITLPLTAGNEYLVGNPYPSAIDADEFIRDNIKDGGNNTNNVINGALYFWEHFSSNSHILKEYQGGYSVYTLMGGTEAINNDTRINYTGSLTSTKGAPVRHIPVGQGFFVRAILDPELTGAINDPNLTSTIDGGQIIFKNSQRVFQTEASGLAVFYKANSSKREINNTNYDTRPKIRLMFDSPKGYHRQLLTGADENATNHFDFGYDAPLIEDNAEDMFWMVNNSKFIIQAVNNFESNLKLPLGIKIKKPGLATIRIDELENINPSLNINLYDKALNVTQNLRESNYQIHLDAGMHLDRFEITFSKNEALGISENKVEQIGTYFSNDINSIVINNPTAAEIISVELSNIVGQSIFQSSTKTSKTHLKYRINHLQMGNYILRIKTRNGFISKKVVKK